MDKPLRPEIEAYLRRHYPCRAVLYGAFKEAADQLGATREYVRQIANAMGIGRLYRTAAVCPGCGGGKDGKARLCRTCWRESLQVALPCNNCGAPVTRSARQLARRVGKDAPQVTPNGPARYSGNVYCDRRCFGQWAGRTHGFARRGGRP